MILSALLKFKNVSSNFTVELEVFSKIFFILFFRLKYNFICVFDLLFSLLYLFMSSNLAAFTMFIKYIFIFYIELFTLYFKRI